MKCGLIIQGVVLYGGTVFVSLNYDCFLGLCTVLYCFSEGSFWYGTKSKINLLKKQDIIMLYHITLFPEKSC